MKKFLTLLVMLFSLSCLFLGVGCSDEAYKVSLDANGGIVSTQELEFKMGDEYLLPTPIKDGYTFDCWMKGDFIFPQSGKWNTESDITLTAKYTANKYKVSIVDVLNNPISTTEVSYGEGYELSISNDIKQMLKCLKNSKTGEEVSLLGESWGVNEDVTLIAEYKPTKISLNLNGGLALFDTEIIVNYGENVDLSLYVPKKEDYSFDYWSFNGAKYQGGVWETLSESVEFTAVWKEAFNSYNVSITDVLGNFIASAEVTYHKEYQLPVPNKIESMLVGYKNSKTGESVSISGDSWEIKEDVVLIAEYKPTKITFNLNGGTADFDVEILVNYGKNVDLSLYLPTKEDYSFEYWQYKGVKYEGGIWTNLVESAEFTAVWKEIIYNFNVSIVNVLNNPISTQQVTYKRGYELNIPDEIKGMLKDLKNSKTGESVSISGDSWEIKEDVVLIAEYKPTKITFNLNGGTADFDVEIIVNYGESIDLSNYIPTRKGMPFVCWKYNGVKYEGGIWTNLVESAEFIAAWKEYSDNH